MNLRLVHPTGNPFARQAAIALAEMKMLAEISTGFAYNPQQRWAKLVARYLPHLATELARRTWLMPSASVKLRQFPGREIIRFLLLRYRLPDYLGISPQRFTDWVYQAIDRDSARGSWRGITGVYAYEDGALSLFTAAKERGLKCFYDLPIVYYRYSQTIQQTEAENHPELAAALLSLREPVAKLERKDRELTLADRVIVPSQIVKQSLQNAPVERDRIEVIPFGAPTAYFYPQPKRDRVFRILFVGRVGPRKGVHYLLQAWRSLKLKDAELQLIGVNEFPLSWWDKYRDTVNYLPSIPHYQLGDYYTQASVFIFPSLIEGLALVRLEALAGGLPIITTCNAGGDGR
jgi:glycosyltransferase involved in cell wall biosynthesis